MHIITGDKDTFYLDGAVRLLDQSLKQLGSDAEVILLPGRGHVDYLTPGILRRHARADDRLVPPLERKVQPHRPCPDRTPAASHSP